MNLFLFYTIFWIWSGISILVWHLAEGEPFHIEVTGWAWLWYVPLFPILLILWFLEKLSDL